MRASLALVLLLALAAPAPAARALRPRRPAPPTAPTPVPTGPTLLLGSPPNQFRCTIVQHSKSKIKPASGLKYASHSVSAPETLIEQCSLMCVTSSNTSMPCVGFVQDSPMSCALAFYGGSIVVEALPSTAKGFKTSTVLLSSDCYSAVDPNSNAPTSFPTAYPSSGGTASCEVLPPSVPSGFSSFTPIQLDSKTCEITQVAGLGVSYYEYTDFTCGLETCVALCYYDGNCKYALYSASKQTCYKSTKLQITDSPEQVISYNRDGWQAYARKALAGGDSGVAYYSGFCANKIPSECAQFPQCSWNKGKRGYNDYTLGGNAGGYCGRVSCVASSSTPTAIP